MKTKARKFLLPGLGLILVSIILLVLKLATIIEISIWLVLIPIAIFFYQKILRILAMHTLSKHDKLKQ